MYKGCNAQVVKPVTSKTCGIHSHPCTIYLIKCSHPWQTGRLLDCNEQAATASQSSPISGRSNDELLDAINELLDSKFVRLENELKVLQSSLERLNDSLSNVNGRVDKLESTINSLDDKIIEEINERNRRSHNIILFNLMEADGTTDNSSIETVLQKIDSHLASSNFTVKRFGKKE